MLCSIINDKTLVLCTKQSVQIEDCVRFVNDCNIFMEDLIL